MDIFDKIEAERKSKENTRLAQIYAEDFLKENQLWDKFLDYADKKEAAGIKVINPYEYTD